jgi:hypothetical protein
MLALLCLLVTPGSSAQDAYLSRDGGKWETLVARRGDQAATLTVQPAQQALLVLRKPVWMVLDDHAAPLLRSAAADGQAVEVGEMLDVTAETHGPTLRVQLADDANPVDPTSAAILVDGRRFAPAAAERADGGLAATFDLSSLPVGGYTGALEARDLAPQGNTLRVPLHLTVNGILRQSDGQTITVARAGREYTIGGAGKGQGFVRLGDTGAVAYVTTQVNDKFVYARNIVATEEIDEGRGVRLTADVIGIDNQDFGQIAKLEFDVTTRADFPGILLTSRATNLDADGSVYCFWGWLPGKGFVTLDGEQAWSMTYRDIGKVGWAFLPPTSPGSPGIGMLSDLKFGESRFGTLLLYTDPQRLDTPKGGAVEMKLAFVQADDAQAVADAYQTLEAANWFARP